jgi:CysZ protein
MGIRKSGTHFYFLPTSGAAQASALRKVRPLGVKRTIFCFFVSTMRFFRQISEGMSAYGDAHRFIIRHKLWGYLIVPGLIHIALIIGVIALAFYAGDAIAAWVLDFFTVESTILNFLIGLFVGLLIKLAILYLYALFYKYLVLIIMSPVLALLSEKVDNILTGRDYPFDLKQLMKDVARGIAIALRNLGVEVLFMIGFYILSFIPLVNLVSMVVMFFVQSYFTGFSMLDYSNERHKLSVSQSITFIRNNKGIAIGNGMVFYFTFLIPFVGWFIAPAYAVTAATLSVHKLRDAGGK